MKFIEPHDGDFTYVMRCDGCTGKIYQETHYQVNSRYGACDVCEDCYKELKGEY